MARIRTIKPEFWEHRQLGKSSAMARLTFIGLISMADDEGRGRADTDYLWGRLHPGGHSNLKREFSGVLSELRRLRDEEGALVIFYRVAGAAYYWIPGFKRQQRIDKPQHSKLPDPPNSKNVPRTVADDSCLDGIREGIGRDQGEEGRGSGSETPALLALFAFCQTPGPKAKQVAIDDLCRQGVTDQAIIASAKDPARQAWDFFDHIRALRPNHRPAPPAIQSPF
jgi:hypothetical protein